MRLGQALAQVAARSGLRSSCLSPSRTAKPELSSHFSISLHEQLIQESQLIRHSIKQLKYAASTSLLTDLDVVQDLKEKRINLRQELELLQQKLDRPAKSKDYKKQLSSWRKSMKKFGLDDLTKDTPGALLEPIYKTLSRKDKSLRSSQAKLTDSGAKLPPVKASLALKQSKSYLLPAHLAQIATQQDELAIIRSILNALYEELPYESPKVPETQVNAFFLAEHLCEKAAQAEDFAQMRSTYASFCELEPVCKSKYEKFGDQLDGMSSFEMVLVVLCSISLSVVLELRQSDKWFYY